MMNDAAPISMKERVACETRLTAILRFLGIPANVNGYRYLRAAAMVYLEENGDICITKDIYPCLAKKFGTTPGGVDRSMRHAIELAMERGCGERLVQRLDTYTCGENTKPSNTVFLNAMIELYYNGGEFTLAF